MDTNETQQAHIVKLEAALADERRWTEALRITNAKLLQELLACQRGGAPAMRQNASTLLAPTHPLCPNCAPHAAELNARNVALAAEVLRLQARLDRWEGQRAEDEPTDIGLSYAQVASHLERAACV
jgi:hypothetical protein